MLAQVANAETAADIQLLHLDPVLVPKACQELDHDGDSVAVSLGIEKLRTDVAVDAAEPQAGRSSGPCDGGCGVAGRQVEAELRIHLAGADPPVSVRIDP